MSGYSDSKAVPPLLFPVRINVSSIAVIRKRNLRAISDSLSLVSSSPTFNQSKIFPHFVL